MNVPVIYISGPYRGKDEADIHLNISLAESIARRLETHGFGFVCPHANSALFTQGNYYAESRDAELWINTDLKILEACDAILMVGDWENSEGSKREKVHAEKIGLPIFYDIEDIIFIGDREFLKYPEQFAEFRTISAKNYFLMVRKNKDYSPANILGTGLVGLATRLWDKSARLLNLLGFNIMTGEYTSPKNPNNESIEDNLDDLSNYCIITRIFKLGKWAK